MNHLHHFIEVNSIDKDLVRSEMESIHIPISKDLSITFQHLYENYPWLSPHPEDSIEARWGLKKCEMIFSQIRSAKNSIAFIERTYRKKDPKYASFAIQQQQEILRRLKEEWDRSQCKEIPSSPKRKAAGR
jgi:hypothetical protein